MTSFKRIISFVLSVLVLVTCSPFSLSASQEEKLFEEDAAPQWFDIEDVDNLMQTACSILRSRYGKYDLVFEYRDLKQVEAFSPALGRRLFQYVDRNALPIEVGAGMLSREELAELRKEMDAPYTQEQWKQREELIVSASQVFHGRAGMFLGTFDPVGDYEKLAEYEPELADAVRWFLENFALPSEVNRGEHVDPVTQIPAMPDVPDSPAPSPQTSSSATTFPYPKSNSTTSSMCKLYVFKYGTINGITAQWSYYGSGFFVGDHHVATAAHVVHNIHWEDSQGNDTTLSGYITSGYLVQAYSPAYSTNNYSSCTINTGDIWVGYDWLPEHGTTDQDTVADADCAVFSLSSGHIQGNNGWLAKQQISRDSYLHQDVGIYGYPHETGTSYYLRRVDGVTNPVVTLYPYYTYRVMFCFDENDNNLVIYHGMSGGPVLDQNGKVVAIFSGRWSTEGSALKPALAVCLEYWLYNQLLSY